MVTRHTLQTSVCVHLAQISHSLVTFLAIKNLPENDATLGNPFTNALIRWKLAKCYKFRLICVTTTRDAGVTSPMETLASCLPPPSPRSCMLHMYEVIPTHVCKLGFNRINSPAAPPLPPQAVACVRERLAHTHSRAQGDKRLPCERRNCLCCCFCHNATALVHTCNFDYHG